MRVPPLEDSVLTESRELAPAGRDDLFSSAACAPSAVWVGGYLLVILAIWSLVGRYQGIVHDGVVYALQAAAKLRPDPLAGDVFLRFQSQDQFTVFSRIYAVALEHLGVDLAASGLTLLLLCCWIVVAWALASKLQNARLALLSVSLLLFIPGIYSAKEVFRYAEPFLTARSAAEVAALAALLSLLCSRRLLAIMLILLAMLAHPLMAFPVALMMALYSLVPIHGWHRLAIVSLTIAAAAIVGSYVIGLPQPFIHGDWLDITRQRSNFLFTDTWLPADWEVPAQILLTLAIGVAVLPLGHTRKVLTTAVCVGASGLILAIVSSQVFELKVLLQGQPWRWLWIGRFLATATLPLVLATLWRNGLAGRSCAMLLAGAWLLNGAGSFRDLPPFGTSGVLSLLALLIWSARHALAIKSLRVVVTVAAASLALVGTAFVATIVVVVGNGLSFGLDPLWVQRIHDVVGIPGIAVAIVAMAWYLLVLNQSRAALIVFVAGATWLLHGAAPETTRRWTSAYYGQSQYDTFSPWRAVIPRESEVFWPGSPEAAWLLLNRRSYMSVAQGAGCVFSEEASAELSRRAESLAPLVPPGYWFMQAKAFEAYTENPTKLTPEIMRKICVDASLRFVVHGDKIEGVDGVAEWPARGNTLYLYDCRAYRTGRS